MRRRLMGSLTELVLTFGPFPLRFQFLWFGIQYTSDAPGGITVQGYDRITVAFSPVTALHQQY